MFKLRENNVLNNYAGIMKKNLHEIFTIEKVKLLN